MTGWFDSHIEVFLNPHSVKRFLERDFGEGGLANDVLDRFLNEVEGVNLDLRTLGGFEPVEDPEGSIRRNVEGIVSSSRDPEVVVEGLVKSTAKELNEELPYVRCYEEGDPRNVGCISSSMIGDLYGYFTLFPRNRNEKDEYDAKTYIRSEPADFVQAASVRWKYRPGDEGWKI